MIVGHIGGAGAPYEIQKSLRFRASASAYLQRTSTTGTQADQRKHTYSKWVKRGVLGAAQVLFESGPDGNNYTALSIKTDNTIQLYSILGGTVRINNTWPMVFRDPSAHFHLHLKVDTTQAVSSNRVVLAINGVEYPATNQPAQDQYIPMMYWTTPWNARIGAISYTVSNLFDGYLSEINFIDGQALDPSYFGEVSAETGAWIPKKYTGTYGTNGFYLPFNAGSSLANLTADRSGNGNNWTANNISLTAGATYDWMDDTPTNNFAVWSPIDNLNSSNTLSFANLRAITPVGANYAPVKSTVGMASGKWYWECIDSSGTGLSASQFGIVQTVNTNDYLSGQALSVAYNAPNGSVYRNASVFATVATFNQSDVIGFAFDADALTLGIYKNNTLLTTVTGVTSGTWFAAAGDASSIGGGYLLDVNFGQRPFAYTPPTGFKALCTKNLSAPSILNPKKHFDVVLATGANIKTTSEAVFPSNFLEWIKDRWNANNHQLIDIVRGTSAVLQSNTTSAETTYSAPSGSSVGWLWKAGGATVANNAGSIASQVSANPQAGFSIVTYTSPASGAYTVGHGLGVRPGLVIQKVRGRASTTWPTWHRSLANDTSQFIELNGTSAVLTSTGIWGAGINSATFGQTVGVSTANADTVVAYCFAEIPGYSKFGSYVGNGSADGPFVYCGFRPRYVMIKRTDTAGTFWALHDTARSPSNAAPHRLFPNASDAEGSTSAGDIDILSNGFKLRNTDTGYNANGGTYIFAAFAEQPFKFANAR